MQTTDVNELTERANHWQDRLLWPVEYNGIATAAIAELAAGEPVDLVRIARRAGASATDVLEFLRATPAEFDRDGRLVGFALTLRPTRHRIELDGRTLYTWCAPDTLELPVLLGMPVRVESPCFATGKPVRILVGPDGIHEVEPEEAVVSIVLADACTSDFRQRLCDQQHFFSSAAAASGWQAERPEAIVVPVRSGFALTQMILSRWFDNRAAGDAFDRALAELPRCTLDEAGRAVQKARYARLRPGVERVQRETDAVVIDFGDALDAETLEQTLVVERECCPFLEFELDRPGRRLRVTVHEAEMLPALDAIASGFGAS
jgi:alkylmercury lyase